MYKNYTLLFLAADIFYIRENLIRVNLTQVEQPQQDLQENMTIYNSNRCGIRVKHLCFISINATTYNPPTRQPNKKPQIPRRQNQLNQYNA
jgi:hypothetical protein